MTNATRGTTDVDLVIAPFVGGGFVDPTGGTTVNTYHPLRRTVDAIPEHPLGPRPKLISQPSKPGGWGGIKPARSDTTASGCGLGSQLVSRKRYVNLGK